MTKNILYASEIHSNIKTPSGPPEYMVLKNVQEMRSNALNFYLRLARQYGDVARVRFPHTNVYFVSHPDGIRQILQKRHMDYDRENLVFDLARPFFGNGLSISSGNLWQHQRRLIQPAFHRQRIAGMATQMINTGDELLKRWEGRFKQGDTLDMHEEMLRVTLSVVGRALFSLDLAPENPMGRAFRAILQALPDYLLLPFPPLNVPTSRNRHIQTALNTLNTLVYDLIHERRAEKTDKGDLLSMLLAPAEDGSYMDDKQLRDEVLSFFFAGHDTTAGLLTWAWYALSQHPEIERRVWEEVDTVCQGEYPTFEKLSQLRYTRMVLDETSRFFTLSPGFIRHSRVATNVCGYRIPDDSVILLNTYAAHHNPEYWDRPELFDPERFSPDHPCEGIKTAFFPFGSGPHLCIGNHFAFMEALVMIAMISQRYQLQVIPGHTVVPVQRLTTRPRGGLPMLLKERKLEGKATIGQQVVW